MYSMLMLTANIGNVTQINYLVKARSEKTRLIEGDSETFNSILSLIDDYEGVSKEFRIILAMRMTDGM